MEATVFIIPTRYSRTEKRSLPVKSFADADGATVHCPPTLVDATITTARAKAHAFGLTPYTAKGKSAPENPKALGPSRKIPGYACLALSFTRPDFAQEVKLAVEA